MGQITSGIGLVSGINSKDIIDQLMSLEARPKTTLQNRIEKTNQQKLAYTELSTRLTSLKISAISLKKTTFFQQASVKSSNEDVLSATAATGAAPGSFQFQVARMVTAQQSVSNGFASTSAKVGAGTLTVELGGGEVTSQTLLSQLNGGQGVQSGAFRITDRSGRSAVIDTSGAFTLDDVLKKINTNLDIAVKAQIVGDKLTLTDQSGQASSDLLVTDLGAGTAAANLGIAGSSATGALEGSVINYLGRSTLLSQLNDKLGVRTAGGTTDFHINAADGSVFDVSIHGLTTVGQVVDAINTATGGKVVASIPANGKGIHLTDQTTGGTFSITSAGGSKAAQDLGIEQVATGNQINGSPVMASINTVLLSSLRGGAGLNLGKISITDRAGNSAQVDLTGASTIQDILDRINGASGVAVSAKLKESGNGIQILDDSNGVGNLVIADVNSTTAAELGIVGSFTPADAVVRGANLQRRWVSETSLLSTYNGGKGVSTGKFRITDSNSTTTDIDLGSGTYTSLGDIINAINSRAAGVTASINANGDGLLLTDTAGGAGKLKVEDVTGRAAADLNILGTATDTAINGSFERTITLTADDTLATALEAINGPGFAVAALLVNDGSSATPYRMSLTARNTGNSGRFIFDAGTTALHTSNLVEAQDAVVFYGGTGSQKPVTITSSTNQLTNVIKGLTIDLHAVSSSPVTINVSQNVDNVVSELQKFTESINGLNAKLKELTKFDSKTNIRGLLLGDSATQQVQTRLFSFFSLSVKEAGTYKRLNDVGMRIGANSEIEFDEDKFRSAYAADPESVKKLFTLFEKGEGSTPDQKGIATLIEERIAGLTDPVNGLLTRQNTALEQRTDQFQDRIDQLDKILESKRSRLERQFANMEMVLADLQSQQQSLNNFSIITASSK